MRQETLVTGVATPEYPSHPQFYPSPAPSVHHTPKKTGVCLLFGILQQNFCFSPAFPLQNHQNRGTTSQKSSPPPPEKRKCVVPWFPQLSPPNTRRFTSQRNAEPSFQAERAAPAVRLARPHGAPRSAAPKPAALRADARGAPTFGDEDGGGLPAGKKLRGRVCFCFFEVTGNNIWDWLVFLSPQVASPLGLGIYKSGTRFPVTGFWFCFEGSKSETGSGGVPRGPCSGSAKRETPKDPMFARKKRRKQEGKIGKQGKHEGSKEKLEMTLERKARHEVNFLSQGLGYPFRRKADVPQLPKSFGLWIDIYIYIHIYIYMYSLGCYTARAKFAPLGPYIFQVGAVPLARSNFHTPKPLNVFET